MHDLKCIAVRRYKEPLNQYVYLTDLLDRNERLFYKLLSENVEELMPIVYTPTVGLACQKFGYTYTRPQVKNHKKLIAVCVAAELNSSFMTTGLVHHHP